MYFHINAIDVDHLPTGFAELEHQFPFSLQKNWATVSSSSSCEKKLNITEMMKDRSFGECAVKF